MKTVGVIGGLGPETTAEFYLDIVFSCQKKSKVHRPGIVISSVPLTYQIEEDMIMKNLGAEKLLPYLVAEAKRLEKSGVDFIVMPCNSLHIFIDDIRKSVKVKVLSIIEETVKYVEKNNYKKVGIISTSATIQNKLYETAFEKAGIDFITPDALEQAKMGRIILNLVNGQQRNTDREEIIKIVNKYSDKGVDCVALACTDLQLLIPKHENLVVFDTMKILSDSVVEELLRD